jgi:N-acetylmuramic acid 6-phosphate etherase
MASRTPAPPGPTEDANPRTADLDRLELEPLLARLLDEDATVPAAVRRALPELARAAERLEATLRAGGRWFNLGAGTSGRIGVLDASEIPPTFGLPPDRVQGVIAGGPTALASAVEGAEDRADDAARDLAARGFAASDALLALSASGRTPYALGGLRHARTLGAATLAVTCAPGSELARAAEIAIVVEVGPEAIAGSTRMKGGLAQKMVLHALSTAVMVRLGRTRGNRMSHVAATNDKLRARALRMVMELAGVDEPTARAALEAEDHSPERALERLGARSR